MRRSGSTAAGRAPASPSTFWLFALERTGQRWGEMTKASQRRGRRARGLPASHPFRRAADLRGSG